MFFGQYTLHLDEHWGLALPQALGSPLAEGGFVFQGFERNLVVMPKRSFQEICRQIQTLSITDPLARLLSRLTLGTAVELIPEGGNRLPLPAELCAFAQLESEVVLVGQGYYCELWSPAAWHLQQLRLRDSEANAERFATLNLAIT